MGKLTVRYQLALFGLLLLLWGSFAAVSKLAQRTLDVHQLQFFIYLTAFAAYLGLLPLLRRTGAGFPISRRQWGLLLFCGLCCFGYFFFYNSALSRIAAPEASVLNYTFPLMIILLDCLLARSRFTLGKGLALGLGILGVAVMASGGNLLQLRFTNLAGTLLALTGAACWALFSVFGRRVKVNILAANLIYMALGLLLSTGEVALYSRFVWPDATTWLLVFWIGSCSFALSNYLWLWMLQNIEVYLAASISFITPFITMLCIAVLLGEAITPAQLAGLLLILSGMGLERLWAKRGGLRRQ